MIFKDSSYHFEDTEVNLESMLEHTFDLEQPESYVSSVPYLMNLTLKFNKFTKSLRHIVKDSTNFL